MDNAIDVFNAFDQRQPGWIKVNKSRRHNATASLPFE
jgi:hypothetical protein